MVLMFGEETMRVIHAYGPQSGRTMAEKLRFYCELAFEWNLRSNVEIGFQLGRFHENELVGKRIDGFEDIRRENGFGERNVARAFR